MRTRYLPQRLKELALARGIEPLEAEVISDVFKGIGGGAGDEREGKKLSSQLIFLGNANMEVMIDYFKELGAGDSAKIDLDKSMKLRAELEGADESKEKTLRKKYETSLKELSKDLLKNMAAVVEERSRVPVDVALFGRMTTNQPIKDINACC